MFMSLWDSLLVSEEILLGARSSKEGSYSISARMNTLILAYFSSMLV